MLLIFVRACAIKKLNVITIACNKMKVLRNKEIKIEILLKRANSACLQVSLYLLYFIAVIHNYDSNILL